jgi:two-component system, NtrC family, sensor kinase
MAGLAAKFVEDRNTNYSSQLPNLWLGIPPGLMACKLLQIGGLNFRWNGSVFMNAYAVPFRFVATTILSIILVIIGLLNLRERIAWTEASDGVFWTESEGALVATAVRSEGAGKQYGIQLGDRLNSIGDQAISNLGQYADLMSHMKPGSSAIYRIYGPSGSRSIEIRLGSQTSFTAKDGIKTILAFLYLGIGVFVLVRGNRSPRTFHFYLICLASFVLWLFSYTTLFSPLDYWVYGLSGLAFLILPALFLHFCMRFPDEVAAGNRWNFLPYLPAALLILLHLLWIAGHLASIGLPRNARASGIIDGIELAFFFAAFVMGGALLLKRRVETRDLIARQQMKWISYGTLAGIVPFSVIYIIPVYWGAQPNLAMDSSILFLALIPLSMGYALVHYKLMDVETIMRRSAAYVISSFLLLAAYLLFALVLGKAFQWVAPQASYMAICIAVLAIALLFAPVRNAIQSRLDRLFYRDQFEDRSTLLDFARTLSSEINLGPLSHRILERVSKAFRIDQAALFLSDQPHPGFFRLTQTLKPGELLSYDRLFREDELIDVENRKRLAGLASGGSYLYPAGPELIQKGFCYLQNLRFQGRCVGIIALGELPAGGHFSSDDLELLSGLAGYAAIALENASLYGSVEMKARELERLTAYTESIIESINVAVLALDREGRITSCNRAFEDFCNVKRRQIAGSPIETLLPADAMACIRQAAGTQGWVLESSVNIFKLYLETRAGKRSIVNLSLLPLQNLMAKNTGLLIALDDITEKVLLEDQLMQAEKLSSIGLLAAGIAHEVNTPIAGISSYTQMLLKEIPESDRHRPILKKIEKQTFRAAEIVNGLLNFSRLNDAQFTSLNINQLIHDSLALLDHQLQRNQIKVESRLADALPPVHGNMGKLQQVFVNLFLNAQDAMPYGGELEIQTGMIDSTIVVDISDTGAGIPEENLKRIFDPFFTTKAVGKGTGLGLAVTYGIIQEHGGRIFVDSDLGKGTRFRLKLPTRPN